jgi:hypothetical protein
MVENTHAVHESMQPGNHPATARQMELLLAGGEIQDRLHLEIEAYYLFAKIMLDKVARALEFAFGRVRGKSLDSHDDLERRFGDCAASNGIRLDPKLLATVGECKKAISDHRDYQIAHEKSPRTVRGTNFSLDGTQVRMSISKIYPKEGDEHTESIPLDDLAALLDRYINLICDLLENNIQAFALNPAEQKSDDS